MFDNRFLPTFMRPYSRRIDEKTGLAVDLFALTGYKAVGLDGDEVSIPELSGAKYDLVKEANAMVAMGYPNPLPSELQMENSIPYYTKGNLSGYGVMMGFNRDVTKNVSFGCFTYFMHIASENKFELNTKNLNYLGPSELLEIERTRLKINRDLGLEGGVWSSTGFGDMTLYVRYGDLWQYVWKMRTIDAGVKIGVIFPIGVQRNPQAPASIPFSGDKHFGMFLEGNAEFELKEDWFFGLFLNWSKRAARTSNQRIPLKGEMPLYGVAYGDVQIKPGSTFALSPYFRLEGLNKGFGIELRYLIGWHLKDSWIDKRFNPTVCADFKDIEKYAHWRSEYFTITALYNFGKTEKLGGADALVHFTWDIPVHWLRAENFCKTHKLAVGFEFRY